MSKSAQGGRVALALQSGGKTADGGTTGSYTSIPVLAQNLSVVQGVEQLPKEISGAYLPRGSYKTGAMVFGTITLVPRARSFGHILYGLTGAVASTKDDPTTPTFGTHAFTMDPDNQGELPWFSIKRSIDGGNQAELFEDCLFTNASFRVTANRALAVEIGVIGIKGTPLSGAQADIDAPASEPFFVGCSGNVTLTDAGDAATYNKFTRAEWVLANTPSTMEHEQLIGSYLPDDFAVLERMAAFVGAYQWQDATLLHKLIYGDGASFSPTQRTGQIALTLNSPEMVTGATPYSLAFASASDNLALNFEPVGAQGASPLFMAINGVLLDSASDPFTITLVNDEYTTSYDGTAI